MWVGQRGQWGPLKDQPGAMDPVAQCSMGFVHGTGAPVSVGGGHDRLWFRIWRAAGKAKPYLEQHICEDPKLRVVTDRLPHYQQVETYTTLVEWMKDCTRFQCETALQEEEVASGGV